MLFQPDCVKTNLNKGANVRSFLLLTSSKYTVIAAMGAQISHYPTPDVETNTSTHIHNHAQLRTCVTLRDANHRLTAAYLIYAHHVA